MKKFYFTFGTGGAYRGGWVEIIAENKNQAYRFFEARFPKLDNGCLNFCACYFEEDFIKTDMYKDGNFGQRCHEVLGVSSNEKAPTERQFQ